MNHSWISTFICPGLSLGMKGWNSKWHAEQSTLLSELSVCRRNVQGHRTCTCSYTILSLVRNSASMSPNFWLLWSFCSEFVQLVHLDPSPETTPPCLDKCRIICQHCTTVWPLLHPFHYWAPRDGAQDKRREAQRWRSSHRDSTGKAGLQLGPFWRSTVDHHHSLGRSMIMGLGLWCTLMHRFNLKASSPLWRRTRPGMLSHSRWAVVFYIFKHPSCWPAEFIWARR